MKKEKVKGTKIEIDEKTNEPVIVEVDINPTEPKNKPKKPDVKKIKPEDVARMSDKEYREYGKQLVMQGVMGVDKHDLEMDKRKRFLKRLCSTLFIVIVLAVLAITAYNDFFSESAMENPPSWSEILSTISNNWIYFVSIFLSLFFCYFLKGFKLSILCKKATGKWRLKTCLETGVIGHYYNNATPFAVGGQPFEIYHLSTHGVHGGTAASLPIAAYFFNQTTMALISVFALIIFTPSANILSIPDEIIYSTTAAVLRPMAIIGLFFELLMPTLILTCCFLPRFCAKIVRVIVAIGAKLRIVKDKKLLTYKILRNVLVNAKSLKKLAKSPIVLISSVLLSIGEACALCSIAYFTLRFFGFDNPNAWSVWEWAQIVCVCLVLYAAVSFIPTPGNLGAADLSFYWLFKIGLVSVAGLAFPAMVLWRFMSFYSFIVIGVLFTTFKRKADRKRKLKEEQNK